MREKIELEPIIFSDEENIIIQKVNFCLKKVYEENPSLINIIPDRTLCERCIVFRLSHYLQEQFGEYYVDCDYDSSILNGIRHAGKPIQNPNGSITNRLIDIIIHKRDDSIDSDFICFELKRWDNYSGREKDINNLVNLTKIYKYKLGFFIILNIEFEKIKIRIFKDGREVKATN